MAGILNGYFLRIFPISDFLLFRTYVNKFNGILGTPGVDAGLEVTCSIKREGFFLRGADKNLRGIMDQTTLDKYVNDRYFTEIAWYDNKSMRNQTWYRTLQCGLILLSASTPVMIALAQRTDSVPWMKTLSLITSVLVAALATSLKTFKFEENWINYRTICETLKKEIHFYRAGIDEYKASKDKETLFVKRVETVISRENTLWLSTVNEKQDERPED